jgi:AraC-like DNA-binding protein
MAFNSRNEQCFILFFMNDDLIILAASSSPECRNTLDKHLHGYATIQYMARGGVRVAYDETWHDLEGQWFWPAHPGPRIRFEPHPDHPSRHHRHIGFQGALWNRWRAAGLWPETPQAAPDGVDWAGFFEEMIKHSQRPGTLARLRTVNMLENLLIQLSEARISQAQQEEWLEKTLSHLRFDDHQDWPAVLHCGSIARELKMSEATLRRRFKDATGTSLHHFYVQARIAAARRLLGETPLPIKAVAARLGYSNVYFFSRQFREYVGVSPGAFRLSRNV